MQLLVLILLGCFNLITTQVRSEDISLTREPLGDIFILDESSTETCDELSSRTASPIFLAPSSLGIQISNSSHTCQCSPKLPVFREDLSICVDGIHECGEATFVNNTEVSEKVPYVFLPQQGQLIYPYAEIRIEGVKTPLCKVTGAQQLSRGGWSELRNLSTGDLPLKFVTYEGRSYLQWVGEAELRDATEGRVVRVHLVCRDVDREKRAPDVFTPCVAFRVAGSPAKNSIREVVFFNDAQVSQGLSAIEYTAIGLSSVVLALIYVASVLLYLHTRRTKRRRVEEPESGLGTGRDNIGIVKSNPLLAAGRHFESDDNSGRSESELGDELPQSDSDHGFENVTSAVVHPHCAYSSDSDGMFGSGSILGERLPEEDVRIVETIENTQHHESSSLPGTQRRKLYFNPAYFDRQLLLAPPPAAIEFLFKIREVISIAKHKMAAKRFVPTLVGIPEEETGLERNGRTGLHRRGSSAQGSVARSKKSQSCTGCPGCRESQPSLPVLPAPSHLCLGESRIRAWLEDVKPPEKKWKDAEDSRRNFAENARSFAKNLEYLKEMAKSDFGSPERANKHMSSSWKDNPPMLRTFQNIAKSEIMENDDRLSVSKRSTRSMFEESNFNRYHNMCSSNIQTLDMNDTVNAKVRKAIENSFIKQMEENATLESLQSLEKKLMDPLMLRDGRVTPTSSHKSAKSSSNDSVPKTPTKRSKKSRAPPAPKKLPDMIKELPNGKYPAKKLMDEVIQEMVVAKALEHRPKLAKATDFEVDSLERSKSSLKSSSSPDSTDRHSSPALSTALPLDEELTMQNAIFNVKTGAMTISKLKSEALESKTAPKTTLSELILPRPQSYSLVSEVYVNDGYASPAGSESSGPEIQYEPENPGHLTIKVLDSPENYVKQDDSEYEPDTLDRKPMKLKINEDVSYGKGNLDEVYVDSLERPAHISLRSKGSFRTEDSKGNETAPFQRSYGSLREIYEARLRSNLKNSALLSSTRSLNGDPEVDAYSWQKDKYLTPEMKHIKRQRKPQNQPDVVPTPIDESIYQQPKPPRLIEGLMTKPPLPPPKNGRDRSCVDTGSPAASEITSVPVNYYSAGKQFINDINDANEPCLCRQKRNVMSNSFESLATLNYVEKKPYLSRNDSRKTVIGDTAADSHWRVNDYASREYENVSSLRINANPQKSKGRIPLFPIDTKSYPPVRKTMSSLRHSGSEKRARQSTAEPRCLISEGCITFLAPDQRSPPSKNAGHRNGGRIRTVPGIQVQHAGYKVEDSGYLSSTDSNGSHKRLLRQDVSSVSETDETESACDGASESGAESIGTDSVFFGNFRKLSEMSSFSKSVDSGVDLNVRNPYFQAFGIRNEGGVLERPSYAASDSETDSFMTVLPLAGSKRNSLIL
ncbi:uncharacterized protein LOC124296796 [Neodiprion virginianus]|uniref:uncharacterized protein LOC124296796 n=1 Tax=Neodiprion virginianus TaxID=2961670 RepID=UPI001EE732EE|nr:uncharacterized protein LOC124296796 [Neodiprion virginianus]